MRPARLLAPVLLVALLSAPASARPAHKQALAEYLGPFLARGLHDCRDLPPPRQARPDRGGRQAAQPVRRPAGRGEARTAQGRQAVRDRRPPRRRRRRGQRRRRRAEPARAARRPPPRRPEGHARPASELAERPAKLRGLPQVPGVATPGGRSSRSRGRPCRRSANADWVRNPIDAFIAAEHEARGLTPRPEAPRHVLLRRVYLDLTGLPPTPEELHAFLDDPSPDAYEKVVDRLLAVAAVRRALGPALDGRLALHRLGRLRGSRSATASRTSGGGATGSSSRSTPTRATTAWSSRCSPADELAPSDPDALRATGFLVRNYKLLSREKWLQDTVEHTAQAFLGVTLGCARCHDHMYDPITQKEYYRFRAIFEPHQVRTDRVPGAARHEEGRAAARLRRRPRRRRRTSSSAATTARRTRRSRCRPACPEALGGTFPEVEPVDAAAGRLRPGPAAVRRRARRCAASEADGRGRPSEAARPRPRSRRSVLRLDAAGRRRRSPAYRGDATRWPWPRSTRRWPRPARRPGGGAEGRAAGGRGQKDSADVEGGRRGGRRGAAEAGRARGAAEPPRRASTGWPAPPKQGRRSRRRSTRCGRPLAKAEAEAAKPRRRPPTRSGRCRTYPADEHRPAAGLRAAGSPTATTR